MIISMDSEPIKTELDYQAALMEIEALMGAPPETPEGDRLDVILDVMTTLVETYEVRHYPIEAPDPIESILHRMEALGI